VISRAVVQVALAVSLLALGAASCVSIPDVNRTTTILTPDYDTFAGDKNNAGVHSFLEHRCGTLDCHGQVGRPFRLFSQDGLRAVNDGGLIVSGDNIPDTPGEIYSNYVSAIGLQPEEMSRVVAGDDPVTDLLLITKPTALETHKGGEVITVGDVSYRCLTTWLTLTPKASAADRATNEADCNAAAMIP
jgi:hypothetical protein